MSEAGSENPPFNASRANISRSKRPPTPPLKTADKSKRVRVSRACDQCRAGREKCNGAHPSCKTCETQDRECTYNEQPKKRGIQPNYIRTLELTLAWIFQTFPESERALSRQLPESDEPGFRLISWKDPAESEALHTAWRNNIICRQIDQILSGNEVEVPRSSHSERVESATRYHSPPLSAPSDNCAPHEPIFDVTSPSGPAKGKSTLDVVSGTLKLPDNSWVLLEHYFAFTHTWLPIIERHDILKLMYTYPTVGLPQRDALAPGHAELWSIMAVATLQLGRSLSEMQSCRNIARSLLPQEQGFQLGHVRALLILSLLDLMTESRIAAWLAIGSAVRLLTHFNLGEGTHTTLLESRTKHTVLAAFVLEHCVASYTGAITHLRANDVRGMGLLIEDGLEEWSPWQDPSAQPTDASTKMPSKSISTFNECIRLALSQDDQQIRATPSTQDSAICDAIGELLQNASTIERRSHPSMVIQNYRAKQGTVVTNTLAAENFATPGSAVNHGRQSSSNLDFTTSLMDHPFVAMPNATSVANQMQMNTTQRLWTGDGPAQDAIGPNQPPPAATGPDIFEELAMLERSDSTANPKFMQNLGFDPEFDLAEFFGSDYQPSDPFLHYTQPHSFGDISQNLGYSNKDAG